MAPNARVLNVRSGKVGSSHCYLDRRQLYEIATFDEIVMTKKHFETLIALSIVFLIRYLIVYACEDHGITVRIINFI